MGFLEQPAKHHKMSPLFVALLLAGTCSSLPNRQRYTSFKNFPVVGIKENHEVETPVEKVEQMVDTDNVARAARQVEPSSYTDSLDDVFVEEAVYLTPEDRDQRAIEIDDSEISNLEYDNLEYNDNFEYKDESIIEEENERPERDGAHGSHSSARHTPRNSRRFQQAPQPAQEQDFRQAPAQEQRGGRQTGRIGAALGVLSNPQLPMGITTSTFPTRMAHQDRNQELLM